MDPMTKFPRAAGPEYPSLRVERQNQNAMEIALGIYIITKKSRWPIIPGYLPTRIMTLQRGK